MPIRALEMCAVPATGDLGSENVETVRSGLANLGRHFNRFTADTDAEFDAACEYCGAGRRRVHPLASGARGQMALARKATEAIENGAADFPPSTPTTSGSGRRPRPSPATSARGGGDRSRQPREPE